MSLHPTLQRQLGLTGAVTLGLGSIIGTGLFVALGLGADAAGSLVLPAIAVAGFVALCNAMSSAQLAAAHPVAGGTYEYGYQYLSPRSGFTAGWMFLAAKSASAATAAIGLAGYLLMLFNLENKGFTTPLAVGIVALVTVLVMRGIRRSNFVNTILVSITIATLLFFIVLGFDAVRVTPGASFNGLLEPDNLPVAGSRVPGFFYAVALMFVAYTGYGRIATLSEEVREPQRTIPRAIVLTLIISAALYIAVAAIALLLVGPYALAAATHRTAAPLEGLARIFRFPGLGRAGTWIMAIGAITAMAGVLLNLLLGLSRVFLAMARRGDMPGGLAHLNDERTAPPAAVMLTGGVIALIAASGSIEFAWSFSAFTVLVYYGLTNLAALQLPREHRRYSRLWSLTGLIACAALACFVPWRIWAIGLALIVLGWCWHAIARRKRSVISQMD